MNWKFLGLKLDFFEIYWINIVKTENNMLRNKIERMMKFMEKNNLEWNDDEGLWHKEKAYVDQPTPILNKGDENTR